MASSLWTVTPLSPDGLLDELMAMAWERREGSVFDIEPEESSLVRAQELDDGPTILVDHGDNCGAGGPQDNMEVLERVLQLGLEDVVAGPFWDPESSGAIAGCRSWHRGDCAAWRENG